MSFVAQDLASNWGFNPQNFLMSYCNANSVSPAGYYVEDKQDGSTGTIWYYIHPNADGGSGAWDADPATPAALDPAPQDPEVAAETASNS